MRLTKALGGENWKSAGGARPASTSLFNLLSLIDLKFTSVAVALLASVGRTQTT